MHIRPGSIWIAYTLTHPDIIADMMPRGLALCASPLLADDPPDEPPKILFNAYTVDAMWMHGARVDILTLARSETGTRHLVMLGCLSETLQWDPDNGVRRANARSVRTSLILRRSSILVSCFGGISFDI